MHFLPPAEKVAEWLFWIEKILGTYSGYFLSKEQKSLDLF